MASILNLMQAKTTKMKPLDNLYKWKNKWVDWRDKWLKTYFQFKKIQILCFKKILHSNFCREEGITRTHRACRTAPRESPFGRFRTQVLDRGFSSLPDQLSFGKLKSQSYL